MGHATYKAGDLEAVIGDNAAHEKHRAGYNGLWSLRHKKSTRSIFVPGIAGLNWSTSLMERLSLASAVYFLSLALLP